MKGDEGKAAVKAAIACGYRLLDCAFIYGNEADIGEALAEVYKEGSVKRDDLFIISKVCEAQILLKYHTDMVRVWVAGKTV